MAVIAINTSRDEVCPAFDVVDVGSRRADLSRRRELKFVLENADVAKLREHLAGNGRRQIYNREVSVVRSIYFDDPRFSSCRANLDGLGRRYKLRLRWYDSPKPQHECYLEIKWRDNRVTGKHRLQVRSAESLARLSYKTIQAKLLETVPETFVPLLLRYCDPTLLVEYRREHFACPQNSLRATLDYGIVYYDQTGKRAIFTDFACTHEGLVVMEVKSPVGRERELRTLLHPFSPRVARCSKYVNGCHMLRLVRE